MAKKRKCKMPNHIREYVTCAICKQQAIPKHVLKDAGKLVKACPACDLNTKLHVLQESDGDVVFSCEDCKFCWSWEMQQDIWDGTWVPRPKKGTSKKSRLDASCVT